MNHTAGNIDMSLFTPSPHILVTVLSDSIIHLSETFKSEVGIVTIRPLSLCYFGVFDKNYIICHDHNYSRAIFRYMTSFKRQK